MDIIQKTSTVHTTRYANRPIDFLVIHYTAGGSSRKGVARNVASMFGNPNSRPASADFIVDDYECIQFNPDIINRYTYAVGGKLQGNAGGGKFYGKCKNYNSISIEICSSSTNNDLRYPNTSNWYFTDAALNNAIELARYLMKKYNIPEDHLIRHYDVNQKLCLPMYETELLTPNGWELLADIEVGDIVAQYDTNVNDITFGEVLDVVEPYESNILCSRGVKATSNHRMWVKPNSKNSSKFRELDFGTILEGKKQYIIKNGAIYHGNGLDLSDDELRFLVWIQGDGHYMTDTKGVNPSVYGVEFHLKKERKIKRIKTILDNLNHKYSVGNRKDGSCAIRVYGHEIVVWAEKYLDNKKFDWDLIEMTEDQFNVFWEELVIVDGCTTNSSYCSNMQKNLDVVQALCATKGVRTNICSQGTAKAKALLRSESNYTIGHNKHNFSEVSMVSCVTVSTGFILIRQNGKTFIVGNCPGIRGWNKESGSEAKWIAFKNSVLNGVDKEDELNMTKQEFINSLTNEEAYTLLSKANAYVAEMECQAWAKPVWQKAVNSGLVDGSRPESPIKRTEFVTVLDRLGLVK